MKNQTVDFSAIVSAPLIMRPEPWKDNDHSACGTMEASQTLLPAEDQWPELLGLTECGGGVEQILRRSLLEPIAGLTSIHGKRVRAQLVNFCYRLLRGDEPSSLPGQRRCRLAAEAIELIHAGSLIVDDIEDGSPVRRGQPALHLRYPMPIALNAGNWLYFWPFELFKELGLSREQLAHVYECCHRTLLRAHFGQAIDLGAKIDALPQAQVAAVCIASMKLKTGALMGFAALLGAAMTGLPNSALPIFEDFGCNLGMALQMFDDLGNVIGRCEPAKRFEDLTLARPSWIWASAAATSTAAEYQKFVAATAHLPDSTEFEGWEARHDLIDLTRKSARAHLDFSFDTLEAQLNMAKVPWSHRVFDELRALGEEIAVAYG